MIDVLIKKENFNTNTHRGKCLIKIKWEINVILLYSQGIPEIAGKSSETRKKGGNQCFITASRRNQAREHRNVRFIASRTVR